MMPAWEQLLDHGHGADRLGRIDHGIARLVEIEGALLHEHQAVEGIVVGGGQRQQVHAGFFPLICVPAATRSSPGHDGGGINAGLLEQVGTVIQGAGGGIPGPGEQLAAHGGLADLGRPDSRLR